MSDRICCTLQNRLTGAVNVLLFGLLFLGLFFAGSPCQGQDEADARAPTATQRFELIVVGPNKKPVPNALVQIRTRPKPNETWVQHGRFDRSASYGGFVRTADDGKLVLLVPKRAAQRLDVSIKTPGYAPYWTGWSTSPTSGPLPETFTARLDAGQSIGGVLVNEAGEPIEGAKIHPSIQYKKRPGDTSSLGVGAEFTTNPEGKWSFHYVPASMQSLRVEIKHPDYMPTRTSLALNVYGLKPGQDGAQPIVVKEGLEVVGRVTDSDGKPIEGALIRTKFSNDEREVKTGIDGVYFIRGCAPVMSKLVVSAKGMAVDMAEVQIGPEMAPVDFVMKPGNHVRIRVIDEAGKPIPKTRIFFQGWRASRYSYFELDHVHQYTDENGVWEWNEAPEDTFKVDICRPKGMTLAGESIIAREQEYLFEPPPLLVISGTVVDEATGNPIDKFRVIPGVRSSASHMNWVRSGSDGTFEAKDGKFRFTRNYGYMAHLVRIEAPGFLPYESGDIKSDAIEAKLEIKLKKGANVAATILTPDGELAADAKIALGLAGSQITLRNGTIDDGSTYAARVDADAKGYFSLPPQGDDYSLVITHPRGYAHVKGEPTGIADEIRLKPWARAEGTFRVAGKPVSGVRLTVDSDGLHSYGRKVPSIFAHHEAVTGKQGKFSLKKVIPGKGWISRNIVMTVSNGAMEVASAPVRSIELVGGESTVIEFGLQGRAVVGQFVPPDGTPPEAVWTFVMVNVSSVLPEPGAPPYPGDPAADREAYRRWLSEWSRSEAGQAYQREVAEHERAVRNSPRFRFTVERDGSFRVDDVPTGKYRLVFEPMGIGNQNAVQGKAEVEFVVPADGQESDVEIEPIQLK